MPAPQCSNKRARDRGRNVNTSMSRVEPTLKGTPHLMMGHACEHTPISLHKEPPDKERSPSIWPQNSLPSICHIGPSMCNIGPAMRHIGPHPTCHAKLYQTTSWYKCPKQHYTNSLFVPHFHPKCHAKLYQKETKPQQNCPCEPLSNLRIKERPHF